MRALVERFLRAAGWMPVAEAVEQSNVSASMQALGLTAAESHDVLAVALTVARLGFTPTDVAEAMSVYVTGNTSTTKVVARAFAAVHGQPTLRVWSNSEVKQVVYPLINALRERDDAS